MDALEFLRERKRMCKSFGNSCDGCPLHGYPCRSIPCTSFSSVNDGDLKRILVKVEQWSKEHPCKTRQSVFLEQYPETQRDDDGVLNVCPAVISDSHRKDRKDGGGCLNINKKCAECRREFWMQEVE